MRFFFLLKACFTGQPVKMLKNKQVWGLLFQNTTPKPIFTGLRGYYFYFFEFYDTNNRKKAVGNRILRFFFISRRGKRIFSAKTSKIPKRPIFFDVGF